MQIATNFPRSPKDEIDGLPYFLRLCHKVRLFAADELHSDYQSNLGKGFDLWICQLLQVEYAELSEFITSHGADDRAALDWCYENGAKPVSPVKEWWCSYMRNRGFNDDLSDKLQIRIKDAGFDTQSNLDSFFDFIDAEEGR